MPDCDHGVSRPCGCFIRCADGDGFFTSKTTACRILADVLEVLVPMPDPLYRCIGTLDFFPIIRKTGPGPVLAKVVSS